MTNYLFGPAENDDEDFEIKEPTEASKTGVHYETSVNDIDYQADYSAYLEVANSEFHPFGDNILSYEDFIRINYSDPSGEMKADSTLSFVLPVNPGVAINNAGKVMNNIEGAIRTAGSAKAAFDRGVRLAQSAQALGDTFMDVKSSPGDAGGRQSSGDSEYYDSQSGTNHFDAKRLSLNAQPKEVSLNTGLIPNTYGTFFQDPDAVHYPLHITCAKLSFASMSVADKSYYFFDTFISFVYQNLVQMNVSFNALVNTNLTTANLLAYFEALMVALQVYYSYGAIIMYSDDPHNHNSGMLALRKAMTADDLDSLYILKRVLEGLPIPPNLNHLCFYLMQTYCESTLPGAALLRLSPIPFTPTIATDNAFSQLLPGQVQSCVTTLTSNSTIRNTSSILARACPGWISEGLLVPSGRPLHDLEFLTIWANLPCKASGNSGTATFSPTASSNDTPIIYNSYTNKMDGAVFALGTIYNSTDSLWYPGLIDTSVTSSFATTRYTNKLSYSSNSSLTGNYFYPASGVAAFNRGETNVLGNSNNAQQRFGTETCLNVTVNSIRETAYTLIEWIVSLDSIGSGYKANRDREVKPIKHINSKGSSVKSKSRNKKPRGKYSSKFSDETKE